jgi:D-psicose/D-tagatose/L-ribulose 3-epimerase
MKIGVNAWVWTSPFTDRSSHLVARAARMGFDVFEIPVEDPAHFRGGRLAAALQASGMKPVVCGVFSSARDLAHENAGPRRAALAYLTQTFALCGRWGADLVCGPAYAAVGRRAPATKRARQAEWQRSVRGLREAGRRAADAGVVLALEPLNRFETALVNTCEQGIRLLEDVDSPAVRLHLDTFHMAIEEQSLAAAIRRAGPHLAHVHGCENDRGTPGDGQVRWRELADSLRAIRYAGSVVIESFTPKCRAIATAAAIWRPLAPSQDQLARRGLAFLRRLFAR